MTGQPNTDDAAAESEAPALPGRDDSPAAQTAPVMPKASAETIIRRMFLPEISRNRSKRVPALSQTCAKGTGIEPGVRQRFKTNVISRAANAIIFFAFLNLRGNVIITTITIVP